SASSPPPQPMSRRRRPSNGAIALASRPNLANARPRLKARRTGLNMGRGANLAEGPHHSAAMREKRSTSWGSTVLNDGAVMRLVLIRLEAGVALHPQGLLQGEGQRDAGARGQHREQQRKARRHVRRGVVEQPLQDEDRQEAAQQPAGRRLAARSEERRA